MDLWVETVTNELYELIELQPLQLQWHLLDKSFWRRQQRPKRQQQTK